jgi:uncharacterized protein (DUF4415 family)
VSNNDIATGSINPDDAPELTDAWFDSADLMISTHIIRRGRPLGSTKRAVSLRLDEAVLSALRATGPGWQTRANEMLRKAVGL